MKLLINEIKTRPTKSGRWKAKTKIKLKGVFAVIEVIGCDEHEAFSELTKVFRIKNLADEIHLQKAGRNYIFY